MKRRHFLNTGIIGGTGLGFLPKWSKSKSKAHPLYRRFDEILDQKVFRRELFSEPVIIESIELLRYENNFLCRVRSQNGEEGISVSNNSRLRSIYLFQVQQVHPFFLGKDARDLDALINGVYTYQSNYKFQSLALWVPVATVEFAILDMLGRIAGKAMGELISPKIYEPEVAVYQANNYRGQSAEVSLEKIKATVRDSGAKAVKFKIAGRMGDEEVPKGRSEKLIPMVRKAFGDDMVIYTDANSGYSVEEAIRVGRILQEYRFDFFEEPVPFDWHEETKWVADTLEIPIAGGEQESSMHAFRWLIANNAIQVVQPDIFYFGGMIRSMRVALMAQAANKICVPHISGSGLGYVYMSHFVAAIPNAGPFHEFKGLSKNIPFECPTSSLKTRNGKITVPTGPGSGVLIDPEFVKKHQVVKA